MERGRGSFIVHEFTAEQAAPLIHFANERHAIYMRKSILEDMRDRELDRPHLSRLGARAWGEGGWNLDNLTHDPILRTYRFCNTFRELDRVTVWIREHIREPYADHEHLWFMLAIARFINWPPTLDYLMDNPACWPNDDSFRPENMTIALEAWKRAGNKVETGAFMIRAESVKNKPWYSWSKQRYVSEIVLGRLWEQRDMWLAFLDPEKCRCQTDERFANAAAYAGGCTDCLNTGYLGNRPSLQQAWEAFLDKRHGLVGWGPFMAGQVVADLRHTRYLWDAPDVGKWAPVGPGSARGLNRLAGRPVGQSVSQSQGLEEMLQLQAVVNASTAEWVPEIELHDIQNVLCETDKYLRVKAGHGKPRSKYVPGRGS